MCVQRFLMVEMRIAQCRYRSPSLESITEASHLTTSESDVDLIVHWLQVNKCSGRVGRKNQSGTNKCLLTLDSTQNASFVSECWIIKKINCICASALLHICSGTPLSKHLRECWIYTTVGCGLSYTCIPLFFRITAYKYKKCWPL